jgi:hypothetical protein
MAKRKTLPARIVAEYGMGALIAILEAWSAGLTDEQRKEALGWVDAWEAEAEQLAKLKAEAPSASQPTLTTRRAALAPGPSSYEVSALTWGFGRAPA